MSPGTDLEPFDPDCEHLIEPDYPKLAGACGPLEVWVQGPYEACEVSCLLCGGTRLCEHDYEPWQPSVVDGNAVDRNRQLQARCRNCGYVHVCYHPRTETDHGHVRCGHLCNETLACEGCGDLLDGSACSCAAVPSAG